MLYDYQQERVCCRGNCYIAPSADVIGRVSLGEDASIWFQTVVRGDIERITIGPGSNVQDGSVLHTDEGIELVIEANVTVGHKAVLHGCRIREGSMVGIGATVLNRAVVGRECIIAAGSLVPEGKEIPDGSVVMGSPGKVVREVTERDREMLRNAAKHYVERARSYSRRLAERGEPERKE
jgi:carbonic anhydrase/acetyltransferase-like protein (isoleucine patch superfamily)